MKYFWWPMANTVIFLLMLLCVGITKHINTIAIDKCEELEREIVYQREEINNLSAMLAKKDTVIIVIR